MVLGQIIWFGGQNREGRVNNFGFIQFKELGEAKEIYVNRQEMPDKLQEICEISPDKGKGIWVEFEVKDDKKGKKAVNVKLYQELGIIISKSKGIFPIIYKVQCKNGLTHSLSNVHPVDVGDIIEYSIQDSRNDIKTTLSLSKIDLKFVDIDLLKKFIDDLDYSITKPLICFYISISNI